MFYEPTKQLKQFRKLGVVRVPLCFLGRTRHTREQARNTSRNQAPNVELHGHDFEKLDPGARNCHRQDQYGRVVVSMSGDSDWFSLYGLYVVVF